MTSLDPLLWQFFPPHHFPVSLLQRSLATVSAYSTPSCKLLPDDTARNIIVSIGALHPSPRKAWKISPPQSLSGHFVSASYCTSRISQPHIMEIHLNVSSAFFFLKCRFSLKLCPHSNQGFQTFWCLLHLKLLMHPSQVWATGCCILQTCESCWRSHWHSTERRGFCTRQQHRYRMDMWHVLLHSEVIYRPDPSSRCSRTATFWWTYCRRIVLSCVDEASDNATTPVCTSH